MRKMYLKLRRLGRAFFLAMGCTTLILIFHCFIYLNFYELTACRFYEPVKLIRMGEMFLFAFAIFFGGVELGIALTEARYDLDG